MLQLAGEKPLKEHIDGASANAAISKCDLTVPNGKMLVASGFPFHGERWVTRKIVLVVKGDCA
jgi:hypothetical protein